MRMIIKRYKNRKLYNTNTSQYVTLDQLLDLIRDAESGITYYVEDSEGTDITSKTLKRVMSRLDLSDAAMIKLIRETI